MKLRLLSVGRARDRELAALHERYAERLRKLGVDYRTAHVAEVTPGGRYSDAHVKDREARSLLEHLARAPERGCCIALDPSGEALTSERLARNVVRWARPCGTFVVGGALGLGHELLEHADARWSLSAATFPHEIVRVLVAEQLYRAVTLDRGIPYHK